MRVVLETSAARLSRGGTGRFAAELSRALQNGAYPGIDWHTIDLGPPPAASLARKLFVLYWEWVYIPYLLPRRLRRLRPDVVHCLVPLPLTGRLPGRVVTTYHDLFPLTQRQWFPAIMGWRLRRWLRRGAAHSDAFTAISAATAAAMGRELGLAPDRIHLTPPGVHPPAAPAPAAADPFILAVGTVEPRKNMLTLLEAYAQLRRQLPAAPRLRIVGAPGWGRVPLTETAASLGLSDHVDIPGFVADAELNRLYQQARLLIFPSLAEGFGLPALEAMAAGCPVVAADTTALPEVVGAAGLLVDPRDPAAIAAAAARILNDADLAADLAARGRVRAGRFTWSGCAAAAVAVYRQL